MPVDETRSRTALSGSSRSIRCFFRKPVRKSRVIADGAAAASTAAIADYHVRARRVSQVGPSDSCNAPTRDDPDMLPQARRDARATRFADSATGSTPLFGTTQLMTLQALYTLLETEGDAAALASPQFTRLSAVTNSAWPQDQDGEFGAYNSSFIENLAEKSISNYKALASEKTYAIELAGGGARAELCRNLGVELLKRVQLVPGIGEGFLAVGEAPFETMSAGSQTQSPKYHVIGGWSTQYELVNVGARGFNADDSTSQSRAVFVVSNHGRIRTDKYPMICSSIPDFGQLVTAIGNEIVDLGLTYQAQRVVGLVVVEIHYALPHRTTHYLGHKDKIPPDRTGTSKKEAARVVAIVNVGLPAPRSIKIFGAEEDARLDKTGDTVVFLGADLHHRTSVCNGVQQTIQIFYKPEYTRETPVDQEQVEAPGGAAMHPTATPSVSDMLDTLNSLPPPLRLAAVASRCSRSLPAGRWRLCATTRTRTRPRTRLGRSGARRLRRPTRPTLRRRRPTARSGASAGPARPPRRSRGGGTTMTTRPRPSVSRRAALAANEAAKEMAAKEEPLPTLSGSDGEANAGPEMPPLVPAGLGFWSG